MRLEEKLRKRIIVQNRTMYVITSLPKLISNRANWVISHYLWTSETHKNLYIERMRADPKPKRADQR